MMEVRLAEAAGFCFGVENAVKTAYDYTDRKQPVYTYGKIIHNNDVVNNLEAHNVKRIDNIEDLPYNSLVIIRAHGISEDEYKAIQSKDCKIIDATCPYVAKIHQIVKNESTAGRQIIIIGDSTHPEVRGINGHCGNGAWIIDSDSDKKFIFGKNSETPVSIVCQTTFRYENYKKIINFLKKHFTQTKIFDTICNATLKRQEEAARLAADADICFVIGGTDSSNTTKLFEACKEQCNQTYRIENMRDLDNYKNLIYKDTKAVVTAGASTPPWIIKEVITNMEVQNTNEMNFAEAIEQTLKPLNTGDIVKGFIIGITPTEVRVDLGGKSDGIIAASELTDEPNVNPADIVHVGQEIDVFVVRVNDVEGVITLSKKKIDAIKGFKEVEEAYANKEILTGRIVEIVNGGVVTICKGVRVFIPASQASDRFIEDLGILLNCEVSFRIIDISERRGRKKIVGSIKAVAKEIRTQKTEQFWATVEIGKKYMGTVKSLTDFGAFVDLGGIDGLVHISELSWGKIKHPSEVVKVGDTVEVYIKDLNREKNKISLGYKKTEDNPWNVAASKLNAGDEITCKIVRIVPFGAFAEIMPHVDGLIHISQISHKRIAKPSDALSVGQEVNAKILEINPQSRQISLSIKDLLPPEELEIPETIEKKNDEPTEYTEEDTFTIGDALENISDKLDDMVEEPAPQKTAKGRKSKKEVEEAAEEASVAADTTAENTLAAEDSREPQEGETAE